MESPHGNSIGSFNILEQYEHVNCDFCGLSIFKTLILNFESKPKTNTIFKLVEKHKVGYTSIVINNNLSRNPLCKFKNKKYSKFKSIFAKFATYFQFLFLNRIKILTSNISLMRIMHIL